MRIHGHAALGACASALKFAVTGNRDGLWRFMLANLVIDADHLPGYVCGMGIANPLDLLQLGVLGRVVAGKRSGLKMEHMGDVFRPLHSPIALIVVSLIALRYSTARPIAAGMLFHRMADWIAERSDDQTNEG